MIDSNDFKIWLHNNTKYSEAVIGDIVSRVKRADRIMEWNGEETYQFYLEMQPEYKGLSVSVRSQIKRSMHLYASYFQEKK